MQPVVKIFVAAMVTVVTAAVVGGALVLIATQYAWHHGPQPAAPHPPAVSKPPVPMSAGQSP